MSQNNWFSFDANLHLLSPGVCQWCSDSGAFVQIHFTQHFTRRPYVIRSKSPKNIEKNTVVENHRKSLIQYCERSELRSHFEWTKAYKKCQKKFFNLEACSQTVLPDRSVLKEQKIGGNAKIEKFLCNFLSNFQTMWGFFLNPTFTFP